MLFLYTNLVDGFFYVTCSYSIVAISAVRCVCSSGVMVIERSRIRDGRFNFYAINRGKLLTHVHLYSNVKNFVIDIKYDLGEGLGLGERT